MRLSCRSFWILLFVLGCPAVLMAQTDECSSPPALSLGANAFDTTGFTDSPELDPTGCTNSYGAGANDGWFTFNAPTSGQLTIDSCLAGSYDTSLALYSGTCGALTLIACDGDGGDGGVVPGCQTFGSFVQGVVTAGSDYIVRISGFGAADEGVGALNLSIVASAPEDCADGIDNDFDGLIDCADTVDCPTGVSPCDFPGDNCANALTAALGANPFNSLGYTNSSEPNPTGCVGFGGNHGDIWFSFVSPASCTITMDTCSNGSFDTDLSLYSGTCGALALVACDGDGNTAVMTPACQSFDSRVTATLVAGTEYFVRIGDFSATAPVGGPGSLNIAILGPTFGDTCATAVPVTDGATAFDNSCFTSGGGPTGTCWNGDDLNDIWFSYTATCNGDLTIDTCAGGVDTSLVVLASDCLTQVACAEDSCTGFASSVTFAATGGTTYKIGIASWEAASVGPSILTISCASPPGTGEVCTNPLYAGEGANPYDNTGFATDPAPAAQCGPGSQVNDIWFSYTADCTGDLTLDTCGGGQDTVLSVWAADCLTLIGCNDDAVPSCGSFASSVTIPATTGTTYLVRLTSWTAGDVGSSVLNISCASPLEQVRLNEVRNDSSPTVTTDGEYVELIGVPGTDLTGLFVVTIGDNLAAQGSGVVENVIDLTGGIIPASGFYLIHETGLPGVALGNQIQTLNFEDTDNVTHLVVTGWTGTVNTTDIDLDNDGVIDFLAPWTSIVDGIALLGGSTDLVYAPVGGIRGAYRCQDAVGTWQDASAQFVLGSTDTPGATNAPGNDECTAPRVIAAGNTTFCTEGATGSLDLAGFCDPGPFGTDTIFNDLWFSWTANCDAPMVLTTCNQADFDTRLAVYAGVTCPVDLTTVVACNDDGVGCANFTSELTFNAVNGTTYLIQVGGFSASDRGTGTLSLFAGGNNLCEGADPIFVGSTPYDINLCTTTDGPAVDILACATWFGTNTQVNKDLWYLFSATDTGTLTIDTCTAPVSGANDTRVAVYQGPLCPIDATTQVGCDDDSCVAPVDFGSMLSVHVDAGQDYLIRLGLFSTTATTVSNGTINLGFVSDCNPVLIDVGSLTAVPASGNAPASITLSATVMGTDPVTWAWDSGDGQMSADPNSATFTYATPGTYTATLTVTNDCGTDTATVQVQVCTPLAVDFSFTNSGLAEACADFTDLTTGDVAGYDWDFGNGGMSTDQNPSTTYPTAGTFTVTLTVTGSCGRVASSSQSLTVLAIGDCNGDGSVNIADPIGLANYLFGGGSTPACLAACEVNGDGNINLGDVVYALNNLFSGGPSPVAPPACTPCN
ncbi:MAG: PKD domain-containing protein [Planctomycetota bacterium]